MVRRWVVTLSLIAVAAFAAPPPTTVKVGIRGMVCSFCATGLKKTFNAQPGVSKVEVSLDKKEVVLELKAGATLDDATITEKVKDSGYEVTGIFR